MNKTSTKAIASQGGYLPTDQALMLNGYCAIQRCTDTSREEGSMFLDENMLVFVTEGALKLRFGKTEYGLKKNQMALLKKDILVEYSSLPSSETDGVKFIRVCLKDDLVKEFVKLARLSFTNTEESLPVTVNMINDQLLTFIASLEPYFIEPEKAEGPLTKIKLLELLFNLYRVDSKILVQLMDLRQHFRTNITSTVEDNVMNSMSLNQLAVLSGRSLSSFRRDFMAIYNMPPSQWIRQRRLEKARELLLSTTMTVTDVCYTLGFENLPHFSRLFKSHFGNSPSEFKQMELVA